jgi:hypothetical protein
MEFYEHTVAQVDDLIPYAMNSRTHSEKQVAQLAASIREFGFTNPVLVDESNNLIAGHGRVLAARKLKLGQVPAVIVTGLDERKRRALVIADNKLALNADWDEAALRVELEDLAGDFGDLMGFSSDELAKLLKGEDDENSYTQKVETPTYEPTGPQPETEELYSNDKAKELLEALDGADITDAERIFLTLAANRHTVFNFETIANYYPHASKECQQLMEDSALVIIDIDKAIENGYVNMSDKISSQYSLEYPDEQ